MAIQLIDIADQGGRWGIYVALVLIWLAMRALTRKRLTHTEALANALDLLKEAASRDLDANDSPQGLVGDAFTESQVPRVHRRAIARRDANHRRPLAGT